MDALSTSIMYVLPSLKTTLTEFKDSLVQSLEGAEELTSLGSVLDMPVGGLDSPIPTWLDLQTILLPH